MPHRDADYVIGFRQDFGGKTVAFGSHYDGKTGNVLEFRVVDGNRTVGQCQGGGTETHFA